MPTPVQTSRLALGALAADNAHHQFETSAATWPSGASPATGFACKFWDLGSGPNLVKAAERAGHPLIAVVHHQANPFRTVNPHRPSPNAG
jgi:hypothetical protein